MGPGSKYGSVQSYLIVNNAANTEREHGKVDNFREIYDVIIKLCTGALKLAAILPWLVRACLVKSQALARAAWRGCVFPQTLVLIISSDDVV